ncbi:helix-turn-helix domain-containing protein [Candidatus Parcubacteria bacterium]|jgi:TrpR family transcriptional regulator, trp operon repressor|nr:helix-turn-helix domain-containing protein [Candidatus Parcubacteria bacterium]
MNKYFKNLAQYLAKKKKPQDMERFLQAILTPQELDAIPKRLEIISLLKRGVTQREIAEKLGLGIATVTRGSRELKKGNFKDV